MNPFLVTALLVVIFYILIPGIGAFNVRSQWRRFRMRIRESSFYPHLTYRAMHKDNPDNAEGYIGHFRFLGMLEAIQGERVWLKNDTVTVSADLTDCSVHVLPAFSHAEKEVTVELNRELLQDEAPQKISWNRIFSLPEGTKIFVSGPLRESGGQRIFKSEKGDPLTVVIYDGPEKTLLRRAIWAGRQKNEYWNNFTPGSITAGSFGSFIHAYTLFRDPLLRFPAFVSLIASLLPVLVVLPPGVLFFFLYRRLWNRGRFLRAERDLLSLPLRFFHDTAHASYAEVVLADGEPYALKKVSGLHNHPFDFCLGTAKIRTSSLLEWSEIEATGEYYIFGRPAEGKEGGKLSAPYDPFAEFIIIPGNPALLSSECAKRAHLFELAAGLTFAVGLLGNIALAFLVFTTLIK